MRLYKKRFFFSTLCWLHLISELTCILARSATVSMVWLEPKIDTSVCKLAIQSTENKNKILTAFKKDNFLYKIWLKPNLGGKSSNLLLIFLLIWFWILAAIGLAIRIGTRNCLWYALIFKQLFGNFVTSLCACYLQQKNISLDKV